MKIRIFGVALIAAALSSCSSIPFSSPRLSVGEPVKRAELQSLGAMIAKAKSAGLHIVYVHGMREAEAGASSAMVKAIAQELGVPPPPSDPPTPLSLSDRPPAAHVAGKCIWHEGSSAGGCNKDSAWARAAWAKSQPFVVRTNIKAGDRYVVVDELNWWPLLMALRCQFIVAPEHDLSGNDAKAIDYCSRSTGHYHPWFSETEAKAMLRNRPGSGGGAWINGSLKRRIVNWGLTDAVIAVGPMRHYLNQAVELAITQLDDTNTAELAIITESLGSFVVLDALRGPQTSNFVGKASNLTFFANQFALLELARIAYVPTPNAGQTTGPIVEEKSPIDELKRVWALHDQARKSSRDAPLPREILAVSDPSDALTFRMPHIEGIKVSNAYVSFVDGAPGIVADPLKAHSGPPKDARFWKLLLEGAGKTKQQ